MVIPKTTSGMAAEIGGALLFRLARSIIAVENEETRCHGVTTGQGLALLALKREGRTTMREIAAALGVSAGTGTRVVDNLVRDGLAERARNLADRRKVCVVPSAEGDRKIEQLEECYARFWVNVFGRVPKKRLNEVLSVLDLLVGAAEDAWAECCPKGRMRRVDNADTHVARTKEGTQV